MTDRGSVSDEETRIAAATTFNRNVIVIAGAGTGKTTLLVNRLIHLLMREPDPVQISQIVALTFTNKAAAEMKIRLREGLRHLMTAGEAPQAIGTSGSVRAADLQQRYGLSVTQITDRALAALAELEKAQIGTLHSFAAHLLRLHPIEAGVDPQFQTDEDGTVFEGHFTEQWEQWIDQELGPCGKEHHRWRSLLDVFDLETIRDVAYALRSALLSPEELLTQLLGDDESPALREWFVDQCDRAGALMARHRSPKPKKIDSMLAASAQVFRCVMENGAAGPESLSEEDRAALRKDSGSAVSGWSEDDFSQAKRLIRIAQHVMQVDEPLLHTLMAVVAPFLQNLRAAYLASGWMTFDGLLAGARNLLHRHPLIRDRLKREYRALLVDEFQDTDPVQYEIVLYLAERIGCQADSWRKVQPEAGKLFVVGDPKQSIYAFRRADIEAFDHVVTKLRTTGALVCELSTNFRSHGSVLSAVNGVFDRLFQPQPNVQPANVPLIVQPTRPIHGGDTGVELRLVASPAEEEELLEGATATRMEAEQVACLIDDLLERGPVPGGTQGTPKIQPGDIAILFRKLTQAEGYLEALRRRGIPYIMDGEKHFYRRQEVIDLVNVLRAIENPHDQIALLGILRSALGGLPDADIIALHEHRALDYRRVDRLTAWQGSRKDAVRHLYQTLDEIRREAPRLPLGGAVDLLFERLPLLELAAASLHGEQAVANLIKVRQLGDELADRPALTLTGFIDVLIARIADQPEEAESTLAEETPAAVRILTIHKAKGLEFPIVILAGLHHGEGTPARREASTVLHDWSTGVMGIMVGQSCSLGAVLAMEKARIRQEAERRRLLYVGMTRARERLFLSGGLAQRKSAGALLNLFAEVGAPGFGELDVPVLRVGAGAITQTIVREAESTPRHHMPVPASSMVGGADVPSPEVWERRDQLWSTAHSMSFSLSPSGLVAQRFDRRFSKKGERTPAQARLVGTIAHRLLQYWDFRDDPALLLININGVCRRECNANPGLEVRLIEADLYDMFTALVSSPWYRRLSRATIIGREVPFIIPWNDGRQIMEGVIDLLYRLEGQLWIADYKTDRLDGVEAEKRAQAYREQAAVYTQAIGSSLGQAVAGFEFVFLRHGLAVTM